MESRNHPVTTYSLPQKLYFESGDFLSTSLDSGKSLILRVLAENLSKDTVYVGKLALHGKSRLNLFKRQKGKDFFIRFYGGAEAPPAFPGAHRVCLHQLIGLFPKHPGRGQIQQHLPGEN